MFFLTNDLQSKWGFLDGDIFADLINEHIPEVHEKVREEIDNDIPWKDAVAIHFKDHLLEIIVRKYILPELPHEIVLQNWVGHNPIRAKFIDGGEIDTHEDPQFDFEPSYIVVDNEIILEEAQKFWKDPGYIHKIREEFPDATKAIQ